MLRRKSDVEAKDTFERFPMEFKEKIFVSDKMVMLVLALSAAGVVVVVVAVVVGVVVAAAVVVVAAAAAYCTTMTTFRVLLEINCLR